MKTPAWNKTISCLVFILLLAIGVASPPSPAWSETLAVGGTGSAGLLIEQFAKAYSSLKPDVTVRIINPPMGSSGSIRAVLAGAIDLAVPGKPLTNEEKAQGGQDWELGRTPFLLVTSKEAQHPGFTLEQLAAIYGGKVTTWADGSPIRLVLRSATESDTRALREMSPAMVQAVQAALERPGMLVAANDVENADLLEKTPGSLGTSNLGMLQNQSRKLYLLPIGGVAPTLAALKQGNYPYSKTLYVARGPKLSPAAQGFLDFILSAAAKDTLDRAGYIPALR